MGDHVWQEGETHDVPPVGTLTDFTCVICGLERSDADRVTTPWAMLPYVSGSSHAFIRFSMDCDLAQEQLRFYILGRLHGAETATPTWFGTGVVHAMRQALVGDNQLPMVRVVRAFCLLERSPGVHVDDLRWELQGGRPKTDEPALEVDLEATPECFGPKSV